MRVLLDSSVFIHAEIGEYATSRKTLPWGKTDIAIEIQGMIRRPLAKDAEFQKEKDALFTVGRLIRTGKIAAFKYCEVAVELSRASNPRAMSALVGCEIKGCEPAVHRSKFRKTINYQETTYKGGKKDRDAGRQPSAFNQTPFFEWLLSLTPAAVDLMLKHQTELKLTTFEAQSLRELEWFKFMCDRSGSPENYVDVFHLWTAERNELQFLSLDRRLKNLVNRVRAEKRPPVIIRTEVLSPNDLLQQLGVSERDPPPLEDGKFYQLCDLPPFKD